VWIVGLAGESSGAKRNRRQVETLKKWDAQWAAHPLAVHFCSEKHKDKYVDALFTSPWPEVNKSAAARAAFQRGNAKPKRDKMSNAVVERRIDDSPTGPARRAQANTQAQKSHRKQKGKKLAANIFAETDTFYARSLGIVLDSPVRPKDRAAEE
jgi:hypothetical protein